MFKRTLAASLLALSFLPARAQMPDTPLTPAQHAELTALQHKLLSVDAWKSAKSAQTPLDLVLLVSKKPDVRRTTMDGNSEFLVPNGVFTFYIDWDSKLDIPFKWTPGPAMPGVPESWIVSHALRKINAPLEEMGAPCSVTQFSGVTDLRCSASIVWFINFMADIELVGNCGSADDGCVEIDGRKVRIRRAAKRQPRAQAPNQVREVTEAILKHMFANGIVARDRSSNKVVVPTLMLAGSSDSAMMVVMPRAKYEKMSVQARDSWENATSLTPREVVTTYTRMLVGAADQKAAVSNDLQARQKVALATASKFASMAGKDTTLAAIKYYGYEEHAVCTVGIAGDKPGQATRVEVLNSPEFRKWIALDVKTRFSSVLPDVEALYAAFQSRSCTAAIDTAANIAKLATALNRDRAAISVMETPFDAALLLAEIGAKKLGFSNYADQRLAVTMGLSRASELAALRSVGLTSMAEVEKAKARMIATNYRGRGESVFMFRADEIEGAKRKMTASQVYEARVAESVAVSNMYRGLTDEQASYKALARIQTIPEAIKRREAFDVCTEMIGTAKIATTKLERELSWNNAKRFCVERAPR